MFCTSVTIWGPSVNSTYRDSIAELRGRYCLSAYLCITCCWSTAEPCVNAISIGRCVNEICYASWQIHTLLGILHSRHITSGYTSRPTCKQGMLVHESRGM